MIFYAYFFSLIAFQVRTRKFPTDVDTRSTFLEISDRLRDPEWEVRQHALRVLIDVLPTLNADIVDKVMQPVVPELVNNLGHAAPAVRKGALDAFRVFLIHSHDRENTIKNVRILFDDTFFLILFCNIKNHAFIDIRMEER